MRLRSALFVIASFSAVACSSDKGADKSSLKNDSTAPKPPTVDSLGRPIGRVERPALMNRTVKVQGNQKIMPYDLTASPPSFPSAFTTYVSEEMQRGSMVRDGVGSMTLTPVFGAKTDPDAFVQLQLDTIAPAPTDPAGAALKTIATGMKATGVTTGDIAGVPWALGAKSFRYSAHGRKLTGSIIVGRHGKTTYQIFTQYPGEYAAQMAPHIGELVNQWRWEDDASYLVPAPPMATGTPATTVAPKPAPKGR